MSVTVPTLPPAPSRTQAPDAFIVAADLWVGALPGFGAALNALGAEAEANAAAAEASAVSASASATQADAAAVAADASADSAAASSGAAIWAAGNYNTGVAAISPSDLLVYRRRAPGGASPTDPALDPTNWAIATSYAPPYEDFTGATGTVAYGKEARLKGAMAQTLSVPAPDSNSVFWVRVLNNRVDNVLDITPINGVTGPLILDDLYASLCVRYVPGYGWSI